MRAFAAEYESVLVRWQDIGALGVHAAALRAVSGAFDFVVASVGGDGGGGGGRGGNEKKNNKKYDDDSV